MQAFFPLTSEQLIQQATEAVITARRTQVCKRRSHLGGSADSNANTDQEPLESLRSLRTTLTLSYNNAMSRH